MKFFAASFCIVVLLLLNTTISAQTYKSVTEVKGVPVGSTVPMFTAKDLNGKTYQLAKALKKGPVVLLFYRG